MPLKLEKETKIAHRSDRVKSVELHPTEAWLLASLFSGKLQLFNTTTLELARTLEVCEVPIRCSRFVPSKQWVVCGADDMQLRVFNYNTSALVHATEAHADYIRSIAVHPSSPLLLTSADDMLVKLWDYDKHFTCTNVFEGHSHFVMQVVFNPKDPNTFASASLDRTIKVWSISQPTPNFTLEGHEKGVNCVAYYPGPDKPYLVSGSDDFTVKVWDYQTKAVVQSMEGHVHNVSAVAFHPELPLILSAGEDSKVIAWHSTTYRRETTLHSSYERPWSLSTLRGSTSIAIGYDEGTQLLRLGKEEPAASMDSSGKIIYARFSTVMSVNVKQLQSSYVPEDGERLQLPVKELGSTDLYPQQLLHSPNGRFIAVCGDGEFVIYTALAWRSKTFGPGQDFVWSSDSSWFAVREQQSTITVYKNFKRHNSFNAITNQIDGVIGGALLGIKGRDFVCFYDWTTNTLVRRVDLRDGVFAVHWAESNEMLAIVSKSNFFILQYNRDRVAQALEQNELGSNGVENTFELLHQINDSINSATWVGDCFIYTTPEGRLCYSIGGEVEVLHRLDRQMFLLGYLATQNRAYLIDKERRIVSYTLLLSVVEYKTLVIRGDMDQAAEALANVPESRMDEIARFLHQRGMTEEAMKHARDSEYRFQLAMEMGLLDSAKDEAEKLEKFKDSRLRQVGQLSLKQGNFALAEECLERGNDISGLLLLYSSTGDVCKLERVASLSQENGKHNVSFLANFLCNKPEQCVQMLQRDERYPEAAFMSLSYCPSQTSDAVKLWKQSLAGISARAASLLADPSEYPNLFPGFEDSLQEEQHKLQRNSRSGHTSSSDADASLVHANGDIGSAHDATPSAEQETEEPEHLRDQNVDNEQSFAGSEIRTTSMEAASTSAAKNTVAAADNELEDKGQSDLHADIASGIATYADSPDASSKHETAKDVRERVDIASAESAVDEPQVKAVEKEISRPAATINVQQHEGGSRSMTEVGTLSSSVAEETPEGEKHKEGSGEKRQAEPAEEIDDDVLEDAFEDPIVEEGEAFDEDWGLEDEDDGLGV